VKIKEEGRGDDQKDHHESNVFVGSRRLPSVFSMLDGVAPDRHR